MKIPETLADLFDDVFDFQVKVVGWSTDTPNDAANRKLCNRLIVEELAELEEAMESGDSVRILHESVDLAYVCMGSYLRRKGPIACLFQAGIGSDSSVIDAELVAAEFIAGATFEGAGILRLFCNQNANFPEAWARVHAANMAKAGGPIIDGKQCKPEGWAPADLSDLA